MWILNAFGGEERGGGRGRDEVMRSKRNEMAISFVTAMNKIRVRMNGGLSERRLTSRNLPNQYLSNKYISKKP